MQEKQNTIDRAVQIIQHIVTQHAPSSVKEVADALNIPVTTTHRLLSQLLASNLIERLPNKRFDIANKFLDISINALDNSRLNQRRLILEQVSQASGETCNLSIQNNGKVIYFDRVESNWAHRISLPIGSQLPMCCTASGKIFLAFTVNRNNKLNAINFEKKSKNTTTDKDQFRKELRKIYKQKFSLDDQEFIDNMVAIAVPVFLNDMSRNPIFSLSIHAPATRKTIEDLQEYLPMLYDAAQNIQKIYAH